MLDRLFFWKKKPPLVIIAGSTASGKTSFSIDLALGLLDQGQGVEIISADSRQIYRGLSHFSGAVTDAQMQGVPHHLVACVDPSDAKNADWFAGRCREIIDKVHTRGGVPIVVGGTGFWIQSLLFQDDYPSVPPNPVMRSELELLDNEDLQQRLATLDPERFAGVDIHNRRRLIRSIEIASVLGHVPAMKFTPQNTYDISLVYFDYPLETLREKITANVQTRFANGLLQEAHTAARPLPVERRKELGLAYKYIDEYWAGSMSEDELQAKTTTEEYRYAKRQKTFFKKMLNRSRLRLWCITDQGHRAQVQQELLALGINRY